MAVSRCYVTILVPVFHRSHELVRSFQSPRPLSSSHDFLIFFFIFFVLFVRLSVCFLFVLFVYFQKTRRNWHYITILFNSSFYQYADKPPFSSRNYASPYVLLLYGGHFRRLQLYYNNSKTIITTNFVRNLQNKYQHSPGAHQSPIIIIPLSTIVVLSAGVYKEDTSLTRLVNLWVPLVWIWAKAHTRV